MDRIPFPPTPFPADPGWYEAYWLTAAPSRSHHVRDAVRQFVQYLASSLTALRSAPHREAHAAVAVCLKPTILATHPPI